MFKDDKYEFNEFKESKEAILKKKDFKEITPYEPPEYFTGDIVNCIDNTMRSVTKVTAKSGMWIIHWTQVGKPGKGVCTEGWLNSIDSFKQKGNKTNFSV